MHIFERSRRPQGDGYRKTAALRTGCAPLPKEARECGLRGVYRREHSHQKGVKLWQLFHGEEVRTVRCRSVAAIRSAICEIRSTGCLMISGANRGWNRAATWAPLASGHRWTSPRQTRKSKYVRRFRVWNPKTST